MPLKIVPLADLSKQIVCLVKFLFHTLIYAKEWIIKTKAADF